MGGVCVIRKITMGYPYVGVPYIGVPCMGVPYMGYPYMGLPYMANPYMGLPYMGNPYMGNPHMGNPYMGNPYMGLPYMGYRLFAIDMLRFCRKHESGAEYLSKKNFSNSLCSLIRNITSHNMKNVSQLTQMS